MTHIFGKSMRTMCLAFVGMCALLALISTGFAQSSGASVPTPTQRPEVTKQTESNADSETPSAPAEADKPARIYQSACPALLNGDVNGKPVKPIEEGICGERSPLRITAIADVKLSQPLTVNCRMATGMVDWLAESQSASKALLKSDITQLYTSTSYQCRRRNNAPDGKVSEHGFANAVDIVGFGFADGKRIDLKGNWQRVNENEEDNEASELKEPAASLFLKATRDVACKHFTTVLGPEANALHDDHFHFDLGCHGRTCTYKICE